jgi:hypothetical protein
MRATGHSLLLFASLVVGLGMLPAGARAQAAAPGGPKTEVHIYEPYNGDTLNSDLTVTGSVTGTCGAASQVDVNRADAWACTVAFKVYDPCFANMDGTELACPDLPSVTSGKMAASAMMDVVLVRPSEPLDPSLANTTGPDATPFLLELADGEFCVPEPANVVYASLPVFGWCTSGYWFGPGDLSAPLWTLPILQGGSTPSVASINNVGVLRLWY